MIDSWAIHHELITKSHQIILFSHLGKSSFCGAKLREIGERTK